jgi:hypothetical protein
MCCYFEGKNFLGFLCVGVSGLLSLSSGVKLSILINPSVDY